MSEPFIGQIIMFAGNFAIQNYAQCDGQLLSIAQNTALFSILGTTYGGNGQTTFGLPNLRGRVPVHYGSGPGLSSYSLGEMGGQEDVTLVSSQMPAHNHSWQVSSSPGNVISPAGAVAAGDASGQAYTYIQSAPNTAGHAQAIGVSGGSQPHNNLQPYLAVNFQIALYGIYPPRS